MKKVLLVAINSKYIHSNLAVRCLRSYAGEYKENICIGEYTINQQTDEILMDIYANKPEILCISCYIWNRNYVEEIVSMFHQVCPHVPIWLGGPEVSYDASSILGQMSGVTGVMRGEGEETFLELMDYYQREEKSLNEIAGITYRDANGKICENESRLPMDLNKIPFVYEDISELDHKILYYESSRGCPFSCSYCLSSVDKSLRFRDVKTVCKEIQFFLDKGVQQVKFVDRTFNCNHGHALTIWNYIYEHDNKKTNFHFEISADLLNEEELALFGKMRPGLIQLEIGVQSTNQATIKEIRRKMDYDKVVSVVKQIQSFGNIHQHLDLIAGLPYEDLHTFSKSFDNVHSIWPEQLQLGFLKVLKGSYMGEKKEDYELIHKCKPPYEVLGTKWLSYDDIVCLKQVEEMVEVYYNSGQFTNTLHILLREYDSAFSFYQQLGMFYEKHQLHLCSHSRVSRYEILLDYIQEFHFDRIELYTELLVFDLYLRENVKSRPSFAGIARVDSEEAGALYEQEATRAQFLKGYASYDKRQLRKMTHLELFSYNVIGDCEKKETLLLFDYQNRDKLTHQATIFPVR